MRCRARRLLSSTTSRILIALLPLAGCMTETSKVRGLQPVHPPAEYSIRWGRSDVCSYTVDSLRPHLRWEAYSLLWPGGTQSRAEDVATLRPEHVTYELRIWEWSHDAPGDLIYARDALVEPSHQLEESLRPDTSYFWSVRARFLLHGQPRVSDWGQQLVRSAQIDDPFERVRATHQYYEPYCFRTPRAESADGK